MPKQLLMAFTYEELGLGGATTESLHAGLAEFALPQCLRLLSALNGLLRDEAEPVNMKAHNALVHWLFSEKVAAAILGSNRVALYRQQLLYMMKAASLSCKGREQDWSKTDFERFGLLCLMGGDLLPTIPAEKSTTPLERMVRFAMHFVPMTEAAPHHTEHNITRAYLMVTETAEKLRSLKMFVDVRAVFESATGMKFEVYIGLMLATLTRFFKFDAEAFAANPKSYAITTAWFSGTVIPEDTVSHLLNEISASPEELARICERETGPSDFTVFRNKPLVRSPEDYYPVDYEFLAAKTEAHVHWTVLRSLPEKEQGKFQSFWGKVFEQYVIDLLNTSVDEAKNKVYPLVQKAEEASEELCDVVIDCGDAVVLIECKGTVFRGDAKYQGNPKLLEDEIVRKFIDDGKPEGVGQLATALTLIAENRDCAKGISFRQAKTIFPVLVTCDDIGGVVGVNRYLQAQLEARIPLRKTWPFAVAPLVCTAVEGLERWCSYLTTVRLTEILHGHLQANKNVTDPLLRLATPLPPFAVENRVLDKVGHKKARMLDDWERITHTAIAQLGLKED